MARPRVVNKPVINKEVELKKTIDVMPTWYGSYEIITEENESGVRAILTERGLHVHESQGKDIESAVKLLEEYVNGCN